jgi:hypothetical protein
VALVRGLVQRLKVETVIERLRSKVIEPPRTLILLRVDLTEAKHRLRDRERTQMKEGDLRIVPLDRRSAPRLIEMLAADAPQRIASVRLRTSQGVGGFVLEKSGAPIGYVFWGAGATDPRRVVHPDLRWLPLRPTADEVYVFDYFIADRALGAGNVFVRAVQEEHATLGYKAAYGYVYSNNRAALWLYRTTGWVETGRLVEHLYLSRLSLIGDDLYWVNWRRPSSRAHLGRVPGLSRWTK